MENWWSNAKQTSSQQEELYAELKRMTIRTKTSAALLSFFFILACDSKPQTAQVNGGEGNCVNCGQDQKPAPREAPIYSKAQFKKGQWIQWQGVNPADHSKQCLKWTFTGPTSWGYRIEARRSGDCETWDADYVERIHFNAKTGEVLEHRIETGSGPKDGPLKTIFDHLYGNSLKVVYTDGQFDMNDKKYLAYQLDDNGRVYFNHKDHPFHAVVVNWIEKDSQSINWTFKVVASDPEFPAMSEEK